MPTDAPPASTVNAQPQEGNTTNPLYYLAAALALALCLQLIIAVRSPIVNPDGITFIRIAQHFWDQPRMKIVQNDQHPGYPVLIGFGHWVTSWFTQDEIVAAWIIGARLVTGVFGLLLMLPLWALARRLFDTRAAIVAVFLIAVLPLFRRNAADAMSDSPHLFFYLLAVWFACEGFARRQWSWFAAAGAAGGAAYWARPEGLGPAIVFGLVLLAWGAIGLSPRVARYMGSLPPPKAPTVAACFLALAGAAFLVAGPYALLKGQFTSKKDAGSLLYVLDETDPPAPLPVSAGAAAMSPPPARATPRITLESVPAFLLKMAVLFLDKFSHAFRYYLLAPLAYGLWIGLKRRQPKDGLLAVLCLAIFNVALLALLYLMARYLGERHMMPLVAILLPFTAAGIVGFADDVLPVVQRVRERIARWSPNKTALVLALVFALPLAPRTARRIHFENRTYPAIIAGAWIRAHALPGDSVLSNSRKPAFFAAVDWHLFPAAAFPALRNSQGRLLYRFVVLDTKSGSYRVEWDTQLAGDYEQVTLTVQEEAPLRFRVFKSREQ